MPNYQQKIFMYLCLPPFAPHPLFQEDELRSKGSRSRGRPRSVPVRRPDRPPPIKAKVKDIIGQGQSQIPANMVRELFSSSGQTPVAGETQSDNRFFFPLTFDCFLFLTNVSLFSFARESKLYLKCGESYRDPLSIFTMLYVKHDLNIKHGSNDQQV